MSSDVTPDLRERAFLLIPVSLGASPGPQYWLLWLKAVLIDMLKFTAQYKSWLLKMNVLVYLPWSKCTLPQFSEICTDRWPHFYRLVPMTLIHFCSLCNWIYQALCLVFCKYYKSCEQWRKGPLFLFAQEESGSQRVCKWVESRSWVFLSHCCSWVLFPLVGNQTSLSFCHFFVMVRWERNYYYYF